VYIVAGIHGNEVVGTNSVYRLFDIILEHKTSDETWFSILNNLRIIFTPLVNPSGYFYKRREESQINEGQERLVDPNRDFNWDKPESCFETLAGQLINHVFKDNLIIGSLTYHGGDNSLSYPWGTYVHLRKSNSPDNGAYKHIVEMLKDAAGSNNNLDVPEYNTGTMERVVYDVNGGYEDWAYGGSFESKYLSMHCLPEGSPYTKEFLESDENSNRAFIFLVEAGLDKTPREGTLGNQLSVLDKSHEQAVIGNISRNIVLMKQFFEVMRPFPFVHMFESEATEDDKLRVSMLIDVKGCHIVDSVEITSPPVEKQDSQISKRSYEKNTQSNAVRLIFEVDPNKSEWSSKTDIHLNIKCDSHWLKENNKKHPESHFFKGKIDPKYTVSRKGFTFSAINLDDVVIHNFDVKNLDKSISFHKNYNEIEMLYDDHMMIKVGDRYPLELSYDVMSHEAIISISETNATLSTSEMKPVSDESSSETDKDRELKVISESIANKDKDLVISVYEKNHYIDIVTDPKYVLKKFRGFYESSGANRNLNLSKEPKEDGMLDIQMKIGEPIKLSPTEYFNLLGKRVEVGSNKSKDSPKMSGLIVWKNEIGDIKEASMGKSLPLPKDMEPKEVTVKDDSKENKGISIPHSGLSCGTNNPDTLIQKVKKDDIYEVTIKKSKEKYFDIQLLTNLKNLSNLVFVFEKDKQIPLNVNQNNEDSEYSLFNGILEYDHQFILGKKAKIISSETEELVFECFLEKSHGNVMKKAKKEINSLEEQPANEEQIKSEKSSEEPVPVNHTKLYIILGVIASLGIIFSICFVCGRKIKNDQEMEMREILPRDEIEGN
jgi:hypothetical protein